MPAMAALACICAGTAITGTVSGLGWLSYVVVVVVVMAASGTALRALRVPPPLIWIGQLFVLLCLAVTLFTNTGVLVVLPGPTALHDLGTVLGQAGTDIQTGVPPVTADQAILCLVMLSMGLVAVAVDTLAVTMKVPAAAGLVLLCVYAVPASLDDSLLPWWSFVFGAAAFTVMLAVDGVQRHQAWRGKLGLPAVATTGVAPATVAVTAVGLVAALFIGGTFTLIGTVGRLPGDTSGDVGPGQLGIKPFTVLSGLLDQKATTELFDVSGLPATPPYLQALTLDDYEADKGWVRGTQMPAGVPADARRLPLAPGQQSTDPTTKVTINAVNWSDVWLPVYGMPSNIQGISSDYRYDKDSGIVYSEQTRKPDNYVERADLTEPTATELRVAGADYNQVAAKYSKIIGVDPRVENLARQITAGDDNEFDMAQDIYNYFRSPANGFTYSIKTAPPTTGDPLVDFLFYGKTGFCEQYASAMGAMLRTLGLPTRVAIGFTDGFPSSSGVRTITSQDAHAWDEVYFPGYGWITFDPTPLSDGRAQVPGFLTPSKNNGSSNLGRQNPGESPGNPSIAPKVPEKQPEQVGAPLDLAVNAKSGPPPVWQFGTVLGLLLVAGASTYLGRRRGSTAPAVRFWRGLAAVAWSLMVFFAVALLSWWLAVLVAVLGMAAAPSVIRGWRRRTHHRAVVGRGPGAANAAWSELLAESWDRGTEIQRGDTLRVAANRMVREHGLDNDGKDSLRTLVGEVERSWYGSPRPAGPDQQPTSPAVVDSFDRVRGSLHRNSPLAWRAKLLPRSVLRPMRDRSKDSTDSTDNGNGAT
jgi:transglutaminase-like putative cysteine protease